MGILGSIFSFSEREIRRYRTRVEEINAFEPGMRAMSDRELSRMTHALKARLAGGETLDDLLPEAYAVGREAARRVLGERPFDVQLIGGMALHEGRIAEMKTGEGKTLTATLPLYLNALAGRGAHLVTTNDFLVKWQAQWMGQVYQFLGLTVGFLQHDMPPWVRAEMYRSDVTYMQNSELGFDYLRDNMALDRESLVQRDLNYAIVDEVDSILIDEARTPLILSGPSGESTDWYRKVNAAITRLTQGHKDEDKVEHGDYILDEKMHTAHLTDVGQGKVEQFMGVSNMADEGALEIQHHVQASLKAHALFHRDKEYIVKNGEVVIVDEFTGHLQPGRRFSDGIHQAIEAKEGVTIRQEQQTQATITYQNFFRLYEKLAGMTGTAKTEEAEFQRIYDMPVIAIPPNRPVVRKDHPDVVYKTQEAKFRGIVIDILRSKTLRQPVLVGTRNVEVSELIARRLIRDKVQLLALVSVLQDEIASRKDLDKAQREEWTQTLRTPLDSQVPAGTEEFQLEADLEDTADDEGGQKKGRRALAPAQATKIAKHLGINPDPSQPENLNRLLGIWQVAPEDATPEERSELAAWLADALKDDKAIQPLNAKFHAQEAQVIRDAGKAGMVTIATNMAGRGVDIQLGGAPDEGEDRSAEYEEVKRRGGLHVLGTERHESRRIDNQLRGRSGRQGDPGSSRFYVSLEDELMRIFAPERMRFLTGNWPEEEPVETRLITKTLERAQHKVEMRNFGIRKHTLQYDNVMNEQRSVIYSNRRRVLMGEDIRDSILGMVERVVESIIRDHVNPDLGEEEWDLEGTVTAFRDSVPGLAESMATDSLTATLSAALPRALASSSAAHLGEETLWLGRQVEQALRAAAEEVGPEGLRPVAEALVPGSREALAEADLDSAEGKELENRVVSTARQAMAREATGDDAGEAVRKKLSGLRVGTQEDSGLPDMEEAALTAAGEAAEARRALLSEARERFARASAPDSVREALTGACDRRIASVDGSAGANTLSQEAMRRAVADVLVVRCKELYDEECAWHDRALETRLEEALTLHASPEAPPEEWDLAAVRRDAETIVPGMGAALTDEFFEAANPVELAEEAKAIGAEVIAQRDPGDTRLRTVEERVLGVLRQIPSPEDESGAWDLDLFFRKAGEAESEMRALLAEEALRRVRNSRLPSELKNPAADRYQQRALAVQGSWGLRQAFALNALRGIPQAQLAEAMTERALELYDEREEALSPHAMRQLERGAMLRAIEASWPQHLRDMDQLNEAIRLRAYGQRDPLVEYQKESYGYFQRLLDKIAQDVTKLVYGADFVPRPARRRRVRPPASTTARVAKKATKTKGKAKGGKAEGGRPEQLPKPDKRCWCGSGKKYKNCHMPEDQEALAGQTARR